MITRKATFFTSDWHIGHANCLGFDRRPFKDLSDMHNSLIKRYNATVPPNGICYFLGDIGLSKQETTKEVISSLNGTKVLVLGNHDKSATSMYISGFNVVMHGAVIYIGNHRVTLSHCPLKDVYREDTSHLPNHVGQPWHGNNKQDKYTFKDEGQFHLHGHIHSGNGNAKKKILGRQYDVGVVANKYTPVSISEIESWIAKFHNKL